MTEAFFTVLTTEIRNGNHPGIRLRLKRSSVVSLTSGVIDEVNLTALHHQYHLNVVAKSHYKSTQRHFHIVARDTHWSSPGVSKTLFEFLEAGLALF